MTALIVVMIMLLILVTLSSSFSIINRNDNNIIKGNNNNKNSNSIIINSNSNSNSTTISSFLKYPHKAIYNIAHNIIKYLHSCNKKANNNTTSSLSSLSSSSSSSSLSLLSYFKRQNNTNTNDILIDNNLSYYGKPITHKDIEGLKELKRIRLRLGLKHLKWLTLAKDIELLRFLKAKNGNVIEAWKMILAHAKWRVSKNGPDGNKTNFHPELHKQVFWIGLSKEKKPTLVIKTHYHDGLYYNEDPKVFTAFIVKIIEQGRLLYGIGQTTRARLILDRKSLPVHRTKRNDTTKKLSDVEILKNLIEVYKSIYSTIMDNYPDVLEIAQIAPASLLFSTFYKIVSHVMDENTRHKFVMISSKDVPKLIVRHYDPKLFPKYFGGTSNDYIPAKNYFI